MNIKSAAIVGVLQDWDMNDYRVDMERVRIDVPLEALMFYEDDDIRSMSANVFYGGDDDSLLGELILIGIDDGWFGLRMRMLNKFYWRPEDPCELKLEIEEEE